MEFARCEATFTDGRLTAVRDVSGGDTGAMTYERDRTDDRSGVVNDAPAVVRTATSFLWGPTQQTPDVTTGGPRHPRINRHRRHGHNDRLHAGNAPLRMW